MLPNLNISDDLHRGIVALVLAISGNFVGETLNCNLQRWLSQNMAAKHSIVFFIILVTVNSINTEKEGKFLKDLKMAAILYVMFVLMSRLPPRFMTITFALLATKYLLITLRQDTTLHKVMRVKEMDQVNFAIDIVLFVLVLVGVVLYFRKQMRQYGDKFEYGKFLFGLKECTSLEDA